MARPANLKLKDLVTKGYLPPELIPPFNTFSLGQNLDSLKNLRGLHLNTNPKKISKLVTHSIPKISLQRRTLGVPNPYNQIQLMECIVNNWKDIRNLIAKSKYSLTKPLVKKDLHRAINRKHDFADIFSKIPIISTGYRYGLKTDISRFFSTIYTHSIPWAIHGKAFSKKNQKVTDGFGNLLDTRVRDTQDKQTLGLPIGPDTSYIISEILGSAIDCEIYSELNANGIRYTDDFYFFFNSLSEAEEALTKIQKILKHFELEINPEKTEIYSVPEPLESNWVSELRTHHIYNENPYKQKTLLISFFSKAFNYSKQYPNNSVLKYALARIKEEEIHKENWNLCQAFILNSMISETNVLSEATDIFMIYKKREYKLDKQAIKKTLDNLICFHSKLNHGYELSWALWIAKNLDIKISNTAANELSKVEDSIVALTALDLREAGLISKLKTDEWEKLLTEENLYEEHWLFAYEAVKKGWLKPDSDYLKSDGFFSILNKNDVQFYDNTLLSEAPLPKRNEKSVISNAFISY
ncbi:RNA-directed DNA polymerase [Bacillus inaquosorum]|uniref:RNA-directed DNA polymerase n=1 Tax=Bacillus inaquosorum TaxID=483913 RepID=UPI003D1971F3